MSIRLPSSSVSGSSINDSNSNYIDIGNKRIQWGNYPGGGDGIQVLPAPFANTSYIVALTGSTSTLSAPNDNEARVSMSELKTTTQFGVETNATGLSMDWIAIGEKP